MATGLMHTTGSPVFTIGEYQENHSYKRKKRQQCWMMFTILRRFPKGIKVAATLGEAQSSKTILIAPIF